MTNVFTTPGKLCILCCHNFQREIAAAVAVEGWDDVTVAAFPARCGRPPVSWDELRPLLGEGCTQVVVLGRACLGGLGEPPPASPPVRLLRQEQCFHLVAGATLVADAVARGAYLITPAWLEDWPGRLAELGFTPENAQEFFQDFARELVLLDTGMDTQASARLAELAAAVSLPATRISVGIDHTRLLLTKVVMEWRLEEERRASRVRDNQHASEPADYGMAMDCLSRLVQIMTEAEVIASIEDLFRMLFAPEELYYLRVENGVSGPEHNIPSAMLKQMQELDADYAWTPDHRGFLLRIAHDRQVLGLVAIERLAFPEFRERYLNLALYIAGVCGLVIENTRTYQRIKAVEEALRKSEQRYRLLVESSPLCIHEISLDGRLQSMNKAGLDMLGLDDAKKVCGMPYLGAVSQQDSGRIGALLQGAINGTASHFEFTSAGENPLYFKSCFIPIRDSSGKLIKLMGITEDITERKRAENSLHLLSEITANAAVGIVLVKTNDGTIHYANRRFEMLFGYAPGELTGKHISIINAPTEKTPQETAAEIMRPLEEHGVWSGEVLNQKKDGTTFWTSANVSTFQHPELGTLLITYQADITERKQYIEGLRKAQELAEEIATAKSSFLANMSHEIRTPMNAIIGLSQLALNKQASPEVRDYLKKILNSSDSLLDILNDILDLSKAEAGCMVIEHSSFDLGTVLENINDLFAVRAEDKYLDFSIEASPDVPRNLVGDALRLQQVLSNLLGNAIKFTEHGSVTLRIGVVGARPACEPQCESHAGRAPTETEQATLLFSVEDTGIGITKEDIHKLFYPFSQVDSSISRRFGGTGLGLSISHNLLKLMGSDITVASTPGKGSTFSFELAFGIAPHATHGKAARHKSQRKAGALASELRDRGQPLAGARILVAEDDAINQQVVREFLELSGVTVVLAGNGKEALELLNKGTFDAVLMDIHMPVMDGVEATRHIRAQPRFADLPIIALSANIASEDRENYLASGMSDFVAKPIQPEDLITALLRCVKLSDIQES